VKPLPIANSGRQVSPAIRLCSARSPSPNAIAPRSADAAKQQIVRGVVAARERGRQQAAERGVVAVGADQITDRLVEEREIGLAHHHRLGEVGRAPVHRVQQRQGDP
jgi:hypothetical protein